MFLQEYIQIRVVLTFLIIIVLSSCNKEEAISEDHELGKIEVRMRESIHSDPGRLFLRCETLEIFPCSNWYITVLAPLPQG